MTTSTAPSGAHLSDAQGALVVATVVCYAVGYPLALLVDAVVGWSLVMLGGVFLLALGVVTIRRVARAQRSDVAVQSSSAPAETGVPRSQAQ